MYAVRRRLASVAVGGATVGEIGAGLLVLLGVQKGDTDAEGTRLLELCPGEADAAVDESDLGTRALEFDPEARVVEADQLCATPDRCADTGRHGDHTRRHLGGNARFIPRHHRGGGTEFGKDRNLGKRSRRPFGRTQSQRKGKGQPQ